MVVFGFGFLVLRFCFVAGVWCFGFVLLSLFLVFLLFVVLSFGGPLRLNIYSAKKSTTKVYYHGFPLLQISCPRKENTGSLTGACLKTNHQSTATGTNGGVPILRQTDSPSQTTVGMQISGRLPTCGSQWMSKYPFAFR